MNPNNNINQNITPNVVPNSTPNVNSNPTTNVVNNNQQVVTSTAEVQPMPLQQATPAQPATSQPAHIPGQTVTPTLVAAGQTVVATERPTTPQASPTPEKKDENKKPINPFQEKIMAILKELFNFSNIGKFFKIDWGTIIADTTPKDTKEQILESEYKNIFYGGILKIIADILAVIFSICMVYEIDKLDPAKIDGLRTFGLKNDVNLTSLIPLVITVVIFLYNSSIGYQKQKTTFHFVFIWLVIISTIFSLTQLISYIATIFISPLYALLGFISIFFTLLGNTHVIVGCVDFCKRVTKKYIEEHTVAPVQGAITMSRIDVDDVSDHNNKTCPFCAASNPKTSSTCSNCGNNI